MYHEDSPLSKQFDYFYHDRIENVISELSNKNDKVLFG